MIKVGVGFLSQRCIDLFLGIKAPPPPRLFEDYVKHTNKLYNFRQQLQYKKFK